MNKPISIIYEEFKQELADLINNSGLPPFTIVSVLQNYLYEVNNIAKNQYNSDRMQYENFLKKKDEPQDELEVSDD